MPFVYYVQKQTEKARSHFFGLKEAKKDLLGIAIFDRLEKKLQKESSLIETMWKKNEIENYFCMEEVLLAYARYEQDVEDIFCQKEAEKRERN